ncbi:MAG: hypothetical protein GY869_01715 [Planctomycetes bacterium]|nr:hypothetical protein [Planctomycetota bacterium]
MDYNEDGKKDLLLGDSTGYLFIFLNEGTDEEPILAARQNIMIGDKIFGPELLLETFPDHKYCSDRVKPDVVDWNNDGKKDIIVGVEGGYVLTLINTGSNNAPTFDKINMLMIGDQPLRPNDRLMRVDPKVYDWNHDGKKDLLLADEFGDIHFYPNIGTDKDPQFKDFFPVHAQGNPLTLPTSNQVRLDINADGKKDYVMVRREGNLDYYVKSAYESLTIGDQPFQTDQTPINLADTDWNNDGKFDLLIGLNNGNVLLLLNTGTPVAPAFAEQTEIINLDKPLNGGPGVIPEVIDYNEDGKKDLKCTDSNNNILIFENQGTDDHPVFNGSHKITVESSPINGGFRSRLDIADWNSDGQDDLIYGVVDDSDSKGRLYVFLTEPPEQK